MSVDISKSWNSENMRNQDSITRQKLGIAMALPWQGHGIAMALPRWRSPVDQPTSIQTSDKYTDIRQVYRNPTYNTLGII